MHAIEFTTELSGSPTLTLPADVAARLPASGRLRVLLLTEDDPGADLDAAYEQGYARVPEDVSLVTAVLPLVAGDVGDWE